MYSCILNAAQDISPLAALSRAILFERLANQCLPSSVQLFSFSSFSHTFKPHKAPLGQNFFFTKNCLLLSSLTSSHLDLPLLSPSSPSLLQRRQARGLASASTPRDSPQDTLFCRLTHYRFFDASTAFFFPSVDLSSHQSVLSPLVFPALYKTLPASILKRLLVRRSFNKKSRPLLTLHLYAKKNDLTDALNEREVAFSSS